MRSRTFEVMQAPKLRGPFRNVRSAPRTFQFRSRHLSDKRSDWEERKRRIEAEVSGTSSPPKPIRFSSSRNLGSRNERRAATIRSRRMAIFRTVGILLVLLYLTNEALKWVEARDYDVFLQFMQSNS